MQLRCSLTGPPQGTAYAFPEHDIHGLTDVLLERHGVNAREARLMIRRLARTKEMTPEQLADEIRRLFRTGLSEQLDARHLAQQELEVFLDTLDWPEMSMHIEAMKPETLQEAVRSVKLLQGYRTRYNATKKREGQPWLREFQTEESSSDDPTPTNDLLSSLNQLQAQVAALQKETQIKF